MSETKRKEPKKKLNTIKPEDYSLPIESNEYFSYITGYSSGGAAYGLTWEEFYPEAQENDTKTFRKLKRYKFRKRCKCKIIHQVMYAQLKEQALSIALSRKILRYEILREFSTNILKTGDKVLDLGCGPGFFTMDIAQLVGQSGLV